MAAVTSYRSRIAAAISVAALGGSLLGVGAGVANADTDSGGSSASAPHLVPVSPARPYGTVTARTGLNVREYPTTFADSLRVLHYKQQVGLKCFDYSQRVNNTRVWYKLRGQRGWVTAAYVRATGHVPKCPNSSSSSMEQSQNAQG